jgi:hypothetical protein
VRNLELLQKQAIDQQPVIQADLNLVQVAPKVVRTRKAAQNLVLQIVQNQEAAQNLVPDQHLN